MTQRRKTLGVIGLVLLILGGPAPAGAAKKPETLLKIATLAPEGSTWMRVMNEMDADVRTATGDAVGFKFYPNMVQGDEQVVLRRIRNGQLHGGGFTGLGLGEIAPAVRVLEIPFLFRSDDEVDAVHAAVDAELERAMESNGFVLLGWAEVGPIYLFTRTPVRSREDLSGVKMWLWEGDPIAERMFKVFDVPPIPLAIPHVMTALQTGMVDGIYASPYACIALQWFTRVKYLTDVPVTHATGAVVVSRKAFETIPAEHQKTVRAIARRHLDGLVAETRRENVEALEEIEAAGIVRVESDAAQLARFRERARTVWTELAGALYPKPLLDQVLRTLDDYRAEAGRFADGKR